MEKDFKHIDNIYKQAFVDFKPDNSVNDWDKINKKSGANRFLKFKFKHFNIYYASLIIITFLASLSVFVDYFFLHKNKQTTPIENIVDYQQQDLLLNEKNIKKSNAEIIDSTTFVVEKKKNAPNKQKAKPVSENDNDVHIIKKIVSDSIIIPNNETKQAVALDSIIIQEHEPIVTVNHNKVKDSIALKQFDVRYETVTIHDTVFTHKKKKEKKNSKFGLFKSK